MRQFRRKSRLELHSIDSITHALAGYLIGRAAFEPAGGRRAVTASALASILPDLDCLAEMAAPRYALTSHRGWTHGPLGVVVAGLLAAWALGGGRPRRERAWIGAAAAAGVAGHILLDVATPFGTMLLAPLSGRRFALDWIFIVDATFAALLALGALAAWRWRTRARPAAATALALGGVYLVLGGLNHATAQRAVDAIAQRQFPYVRGTAALPMWPHAFVWRGLIATPERVHEVRLNLLTSELRWEEPSPAGAPSSAGVPATPEAEAFERFARFPTLRIVSERDATAYVFADRQFASVTGRSPFELTVRVDAAGRVVDSRLSEPSWVLRALLFVVPLLAIVIGSVSVARPEGAP